MEEPKAGTPVQISAHPILFILFILFILSESFSSDTRKRPKSRWHFSLTVNRHPAMKYAQCSPLPSKQREARQHLLSVSREAGRPRTHFSLE
jgi:hypothetical protein